MNPVVGSSIPPLGTDGDQRRRLLFHHLPLALATALLLFAFMTVSLFDARAYGHGDIMSAAFPKARVDGGAVGHGAVRAEHDGERSRSRPHGSDHAGRTSHSGHGQPSERRAAEPELTVHGSNTEPRDQRADSSLSRRVQQFTVATGYLAVGLLALTLLLGPANLLLRRRNPISSYLRRDVGIWTTIFSIVHVIAAVLMHVSHGSGAISSAVHFFVAEDGRPLTNSFGIGNWTGLGALLIALGLLATSSDVTLRKLKAARWKGFQRSTYALLALVVLHAFFYGALLRLASPFTLLLVLSVVSIFVGQAVGICLWRRRHDATRAA